MLANSLYERIRKFNASIECRRWISAELPCFRSKEASLGTHPLTYPAVAVCGGFHLIFFDEAFNSRKHIYYLLGVVQVRLRFVRFISCPYCLQYRQVLLTLYGSD